MDVPDVKSLRSKKLKKLKEEPQEMETCQPYLFLNNLSFIMAGWMVSTWVFLFPFLIFNEGILVQMLSLFFQWRLLTEY